MARTELTAQQVTSAGLEPTYEAATADGHFFANDGRVILHVINADDDTATIVTVQTPATVDGLAVTDRTVTVPFGEERFIGHLSRAAYNRPAGGADPGMVYVDYSEQTAVTVALIKA